LGLGFITGFFFEALGVFAAGLDGFDLCADACLVFAAAAFFGFVPEIAPPHYCQIGDIFLEFCAIF
jgi:hypothetical protein